jgi:cytochrome c551/c552
MTKDEQVAFMKARVMPRMSKVFTKTETTCKTCHGPAYKEPKEFLPHLTMKDGKITAFAEKPEVSKFMAEKVVPEMAAAMGQPPYDPATHKGFGCGGCHTIDMK